MGDYLSTRQEQKIIAEKYNKEQIIKTLSELKMSDEQEPVQEQQQNNNKKYTKSLEFSNNTLDIIKDEENEDEELINNQYSIKEKLGSGSFGVVYRVVDKMNLDYAAKFEELTDIKKHLNKEYRIYETLKGNRNFPQIYFYGHHKNHRVLVMQKLGKSLKYYFEQYNYIFDLNIVANIAVQILYRLQSLHNEGWLHQDIKPENILVDEFRGDKLYLVDFGTSGCWKKNNNHIEFGRSKKIVGTARYSCMANHNGFVQCRRDDLESLGYVLIYLLAGILPWQGIQAKNYRVKWNKIGSIKNNIKTSELCKNLPNPFLIYFNYISSLEFTETPNYSYLRSIFRKYIKSDFYWSLDKKKF